MEKDSFIANETFVKPTGVKNLSSFLATLNSKKFSRLNVWTDGSWAVTHKENVIVANSESPVISLNIGYCKDLTRDNLHSLGEEINNQLKQIQKSLSV